MQVQSKVIIRESFSFHIPPQQIHHFSPLLLYDISVYHLFFRTAYHKPIGKSTFLPTSPVKSAPCSIATFLCLFPLFIGPYCRLRLLAACLAAALVALAVWLWPAAETEPQRPNSTADPAAATDPAPDPYLAACQTYYTGADGREYHVFTAVTPSIEGRTDPVGYRSELIPAGGTVDFPATVMVEDAVTQDYAAEDFAALLDSWDVSVTAPEGADVLGYDLFDLDGATVTEVTFTLDGVTWHYRMAPTSDVSETTPDISDFTGGSLTAEGRLRWCPTVLRWDAGGAGCIIWRDIAPGLAYSLTADTGASEKTLADMAALVFKPAQEES